MQVPTPETVEDRYVDDIDGAAYFGVTTEYFRRNIAPELEAIDVAPRHESPQLRWSVRDLRRFAASRRGSAA